ncbi:efflux transporter outer membrane subunit [Pedobacter sp. MC2016-24]|uniref:efflux transporter outer membrane subunit n=1 Tax=Pedobacter sp. MC2016-24 TaxID=2780090 RepID=UPI001D16065F|nr:efflux transporter outer membrane subunit [Pedobacter sp. MC2016-24]
MNKDKMKKYHMGLLLLLAILSACSVQQAYKRPIVNTSNLYRDQVDVDSLNWGTKSWSTLFKDTVLTHLIEEGISHNLDLKIAIQRIEASRAVFTQSKAAFLPELNAKASVTQSKLAYPQGFGIISSSTQYDVGLTAGWEADIWGKIKSAKRSALASLLQTEAAQKAVKTQLIADIANSYFTLLALDEQLLILKQTVTIRQADVRAMRALKAANIVNGAAEVQSLANQYAAEVAIPRLEQQIREMENALSVLLARPAAVVERTSLGVQQATVDLKSGVPANLLQNRPDVKQAEYAFAAAFEATNVARKSFYPSFTLTASGGFTSFSFKDWITPSGLFGNLAAGIAQPIFNRGINKSRLAIARATQQEAALNFQKALLRAGTEVSNALFAYQVATRQQEIRTKQVAALQKSVDFTKKLLRYSAATNYTDVLTSEQNLLAAQLEGVNDRLLEWQAVIALYRAIL